MGSRTYMTPEPPQVLVVEDEPELADIFTIWLSDGFDVKTVTRGREAVESLHPDLDVVVLDWRIPNVSGADILTEIRNAGLGCAIAVITGADPDLIGVDDEVDLVLRKPVRSDELIGAVEKLAT